MRLEHEKGGQKPLYSIMPGAGLEPAQAFAHYPLKVACLPVPPSRHKKIILYSTGSPGSS